MKSLVRANMKLFGWTFILLIAASPAWSASTRKITVQELKDLLTAAQAARKSDDDLALQLKQVELSEELTTSTMNSLAPLAPGPHSTEQIYVLEARSAVLPPPASDLPSVPPPDAAAQQAMLSKAQNYVSKTYAQLPHLTASHMTARFQDGIVVAPTYSSVQGGITDDRDPVLDQAKTWVRLMNSKADIIESDNGNEKLVKDKTQWGPNGLAASVGPPLTLNTAMQEITSNGNPQWLRWQLIDGKQVAVYSFAVDKKKTRFSILYCCFPQTDVTGTDHLSTPLGSSLTASGGGGAPAGPPGNMQNTVQWSNFKTNSGYHGELFLDPETSTVVRLITEADFKPSDFVHYENIRTDYASVPIGGKSVIVPVRSFTIAELVPNGDANAARVTIRHQFTTQDYKDYRVAGTTAASAMEEDSKPLVDNTGKRMIQAINADVLAARAANKDKRYADAEAIILKDTESKPDLILPWIELGLAQIGLKKYTEAETSFKTALAIDPRSPKSQRDIEDALHPAHFARRATVSYNITEQDRAPEVMGIIDSSLGEIYIRTNRVLQAKAAFDTAAEANPAQAAFYLRNETLFYFQTGNTDAQLKAAEKAIAADANGAVPYYFKAQALVSKASVDPQTQKMILPPGCAEAYQKYLELEPNGQFSADAKSVLTAAGVPVPSSPVPPSSGKKS